MGKIENNFVSYTQALALKQLGFKEPCLARYNDNEFDINLIISESCFNVTNSKTTYGNFKNYNIGVFEDEGTISAPLYSQAFEWIRDEFELRYKFEPSINDTVDIFTWLIVGWRFFKNVNEKEAESACLDKLIEICKN